MSKTVIFLHFSEMDFPKEFAKKNSMKNKCKKNIQNLGASCFEMGSVNISQNNPMLNFQKDLSTSTKAIAHKPMCLQKEQHQQNLCGCKKTLHK